MTEDQVPRPLIGLYWPDLAQLVDSRYYDPAGLAEILYELGFRQRAGAARARERVIDRLIELSEDGFAWPSTGVSSGDGYLEADNWPQRGMLSFIGYHVGESGLDDSSRQEILDAAYVGKLPNVNDSSYMSCWGAPGTANRLRKLAESLAAFCRNQKYKNPNALCVEEWEADLEHLRSKYYVGRYDFTWPTTEVS